MYNPTKWQDHITEPQNEYIVEPIEGNKYKITPCGNVISRGTLLSAENFNKNEKGIMEAVTALGMLLHKTALDEDKFSSLSSLVISTLLKEIYITEEKTIKSDSFNSETLLVSTSYKFPDGSERNNNNYAVIPLVTNIDASGVATVKQASIPTIVINNQTTEGFDIRYYLSSQDSCFKTVTYKMLIIGGL